MAAPELKPCPFCGSERAAPIPANRNSRIYPIVRCMGCYLDLPGDNDDYSLDCRSAVKAWNTRADVADAMVKAERERCAEIARTLFATGDATPGAIPPDDQIAGEAIAAAIMEGQGDE